MSIIEYNILIIGSFDTKWNMKWKYCNNGYVPDKHCDFCIEPSFERKIILNQIQFQITLLDTYSGKFKILNELYIKKSNGIIFCCSIKDNKNIFNTFDEYLNDVYRIKNTTNVPILFVYDKILCVVKL